MSKTKSKATKTRTLHVPKELHQRISILAAHRDEDIQEVAVQAIKAGLPTLGRHPEPAVVAN